MWGESEGILRQRSRARRVRFRMLAWQEFFLDFRRQFAERAKRVEGKETQRDTPGKSQVATLPRSHDMSRHPPPSFAQSYLSLPAAPYP
jgi:hypothetical protein